MKVWFPTQRGLPVFDESVGRSRTHWLKCIDVTYCNCTIEHLDVQMSALTVHLYIIGQMRDKSHFSDHIVYTLERVRDEPDQL